jgi:hypothetical protein
MATMKAARTVTLDSLLDEIEVDGRAQYRAAQRQGDEDRVSEAQYLGAQLARLLVRDARRMGATTDEQVVTALFTCESDVVVAIGEECAWALYQQGRQGRQIRQRQGA